jgi:recombination protein RecR
MSEEYSKLFDYFKTFPGIGKRQAERFVFHILTKDQYWVDNFINEIKKAKENIRECVDCCRVFRNKYGEKHDLCEICRSTVRDHGLLAVVEKNIDADVLLSKGSWPGLVFVLGGQFQVIEKKNPPRVHLEELLKFVKKLSPSLKEIVLCTSLNPDGIFTAEVSKQKINEMLEKENLPHPKITTFGRGFSTGTELEYADRDTLQNALRNRTENI